jgi:mannose-6-phosphate isomerase-like protein (cupin superfamily)
VTFREPGDVRRVVLGRAGDGRSTVTSDALAPVAHRPGAGYAITEIWATSATPPPVDGDDPTLDSTGLDTELPRGQTRFWVAEFPPGNGGLAPFLHSTPTLDYLAVLSGSVTLELEDGEVTLHAGDTAIQRANVHAWRNDGAEPCRVAVVMLGLR